MQQVLCGAVEGVSRHACSAQSLLSAGMVLPLFCFASRKAAASCDWKPFHAVVTIIFQISALLGRMHVFRAVIDAE